ncbi:MAG TPA: hypothetical protein DEF00_04325 [Candidatus Taylorbacteria bacterium]|nr:hypothetical protein [Candidatus Taylorbacteria bacterium]
MDNLFSALILTYMKAKTKLEVVAGLAAAVAGAYYFYYSKSAYRNRAIAKAWMEKAEDEIMTEVRKIKNAMPNGKDFKNIVAAVSSKYERLRKLENREVKAFTKALSSSWTRIKRDLVKEKDVLKKN